MIRPVDALLQFLQAEQARGVTHVHLDEDSRLALRELHNRSKSGNAGDSSSATRSARQIAVAAPAPCRVPATVTIAGGSKTERLDSLRRQAERWSSACGLQSLRDVMVFSGGDSDARLMLVDEAPGYQEERSKKPLAGTSGEKLDLILKAMGLSREQVYITHLVKFRPSTPRQTTNERRSTPAEMAAFLPILAAEIEVIRPEAILVMGETAAQGLLGMDAASTALRGRWHTFQSIPVRVTLHPGRLLQTTAGNAMKRQLWEDMLEVMEKLAMPVSEKQRGFFLKP